MSVLVSNLFWGDYELTSIATAPLGMKPKICRRYDSFEIIMKDQRDPFTGSIKFTDEREVETISFLDAQITRKENGTLKVKVYRKKTHTEQFLNFESH